MNAIRDTIWARVPFEDEMLPSAEALKLHRWRSVWVIHLWSQADKQLVEPKDVTSSGWETQADSGVLKVVWDTAENIANIQERISLLTRGCGCKTGCCSKRCQCARKGQYCGPRCKCVQCCNIQSEPTVSDSEDDLQLQEEIEDIRERYQIERRLEADEVDSESTICVNSEPGAK